MDFNENEGEFFLKKSSFLHSTLFVFFCCIFVFYLSFSCTIYSSFVFFSKVYILKVERLLVFIFLLFSSVLFQITDYGAGITHNSYEVPSAWSFSKFLPFLHGFVKKKSQYVCFGARSEVQKYVIGDHHEKSFTLVVQYDVGLLLLLMIHVTSCSCLLCLMKMFTCKAQTLNVRIYFKPWKLVQKLWTNLWHKCLMHFVAITLMWTIANLDCLCGTLRNTNI